MRKTVKDEQVKAWLKEEMRPYRGHILFLAFLCVFVSLLSVAFAYIVRYLINSAARGEKDLLWIFSAVLVVLLLIRIFLKTTERFHAEKVRSKLTANFRVKTYAKLLRADYAKAHAYHSGELLTRLTADIQEVCGYTVSLTPAVAGMSVQILGAVVALFTLDPLFTAIYVLSGGALVALTAMFRKRIKTRQKEVLEADGSMRAYMQESFSSLATIKAYGAENKSANKAQEFASSYYDKRMKRNALQSFTSAIYSLTSNFGLIFALVWCGASVLSGNRDYGAILSAILLLMQLHTPLSSFSALPSAYYARLAGAERLQELYALEDEEETKTVDVKGVYHKLQTISMTDLEFSYGREPVLTGVNATIRKGESVCLTGSSGTGKSTFFKLLLAIYPPISGEMALQGDFETPITLSKDTRALFAYVPQGNFLFSGSIYENLTFFVQDQIGLEDRIKSALEIACAEFVFELPNGLQTQLTERGGGLSEGQLQRLAIARALLSERPILLLDEATSALDMQTEEQLLKNLKGLKEKTCILVTHRQAALAIADRVLTIKNGKLIEKTER